MIATRLLVIPLLAGATLVGACFGDKAESADVAGLPTVFDSTGDTIRARVVGAVDSSDIRTLVAEVRIAGEIGDSILFGNAGNLTLNPSGAVAVYDYTSTQLLLFAPDGALIGRMGSKGSGPGEYQDVNGIAPLADSTWAVYDAGSSRVSFFSANGAFRDSWNVPSTNFIGSYMLVTDSSRALRLAQFVVPPSGDFMAANFGYARVLPGGAGLADTAAAPTLGVEAPEYRTEGPTEGGRSSTMTTSQLSPSEIASWHPDGHWVLMEGGGYRVLIAKRDGKPIVVTRDAPNTPVHEDERAYHEERTIWAMRRVNPAWTWQGPPIPKVRAPARHMLIARDGTVWVQVALPSERIPEADRDEQRPGAQPVRRWRERSAYEVFDRTGTFLGRVALPPRTTLQEAAGDVVWGTQVNEDDVPTVVRFRVVPRLGDR
jgi:hypothetical protein